MNISKGYDVKVIIQCTVILQLLIFFPNLGFTTEYTVAVRAHKGIDIAIKKWQPTLDLMNKAIPQHTFVLLPIVSLNDITQRAGKGEFQFILTNPSSFVEIKEYFSAKKLVTLNNKRANTAQNKFGSVIFTHVLNEDIVSIKDLKGKNLIAVSEPAFGGWRVAWLEMLNQNFDPMKKLNKIMFTKNGTQQEVVQAVLDGTADAGVVRTDLLERMEQSGKVDMRYLRVINNKYVENFPFLLSTPLYPEWVFSSLQSVPDILSEKVKNTLLDISYSSDAAKAGNYIGWVSAKDYSSVKALMQRLKVGPFSKHKKQKKIR